MAITEFNLQIPNRRVDHQYSGDVKYVRVFQAILDEPATTDTEVLTDPLVPKIYTPHPDDPVIILSHRSAATVDDTRLIWNVTLTYGQHYVNPHSNSDLSFDEDRFDEQNPEKQRVSWSFAVRKEPLHYSRMYVPGTGKFSDFHVPVTTSAQLRYDPLPQRDVYDPVCTIQRNELSTAGLDHLLDYANSMNKDVFTIDGLTIQPRLARLGTISVTPEKKDKDNGQVFRTITWQLYFRDERSVNTHYDSQNDKTATASVISGWDIALLDQDFYEAFPEYDKKDKNKVVAVHLSRIVDDKRKDDVDRPFLLNGEGQRIKFAQWPPTSQELADKAIYRVYRPLKEKNFNFFHWH